MKQGWRNREPAPRPTGTAHLCYSTLQQRATGAAPGSLGVLSAQAAGLSSPLLHRGSSSQWWGKCHFKPLTQAFLITILLMYELPFQLLFLLCSIFFQFFLLSVWLRFHLHQVDHLNPATFSLVQQDKSLSQKIRSRLWRGKKKFPWTIERKIRVKMQMCFLVWRSQFGSCAPKAIQIQKLYFPAFAMPSFSSFLTEGFILIYKEVILTVQYK